MLFLFISGLYKFLKGGQDYGNNITLLTILVYFYKSLIFNGLENAVIEALGVGITAKRML